jgi:hypothetical protein
MEAPHSGKKRIISFYQMRGVKGCKIRLLGKFYIHEKSKV